MGENCFRLVTGFVSSITVRCQILMKYISLTDDTRGYLTSCVVFSEPRGTRENERNEY